MRERLDRGSLWALGVTSMLIIQVHNWVGRLLWVLIVVVSALRIWYG